MFPFLEKDHLFSNRNVLILNQLVDTHYSASMVTDRLTLRCGSQYDVRHSVASPRIVRDHIASHALVPSHHWAVHKFRNGQELYFDPRACMNNHIYSTLFKIQERKSDRRSREIEQRKESQNTHTHKTRTCELNLLR